MAINLSDEIVLTKFDALTKQGIIHHGPSTATPLIDQGFPFEFRICPSWSAKPLTVDGKVPTPQGGGGEEPPTFGPGSDINLSHPTQVLGTIHSTHILAFNIYPLFRPQFLLLTSDSSRLQSEPLDRQDVHAAWDLLRVKGGEEFYVLYNGGQEAGCSRNHKHVQIVPRPQFACPQGQGQGARGFRFFPDVEDYERWVRVPYVYFLYYFEKGEERDADVVWGIYQELLGKCRDVLGIREGEGEEMVCAHNVILTVEWMLLIPRRRGTYRGIMANAAGMMGMPTMANERLFEIWREIGPSKALSEFGVPIGGVV